MTQLYSVRSQLSWGLGDLADLAGACSRGAPVSTVRDFVLVNPLHAAEVVAPMQPSPYLPASRRFVNPVYLRVEDIRGGRLHARHADRVMIEWSRRGDAGPE